MNDTSFLNLQKKIYQKSIWNDIVTVAHGGNLQFPIVVDLDPTSFCDLACPECISSSMLKKTKFDTHRLIQLAEELKEGGVRAVVLIGGGEPLISPKIDCVVQILGDAEIDVGLVTNGTNLNRFVDVLAKYTKWIRVSVDAGTSECYQRFRPSLSGHNMFGTVIRNMCAFAKVKTGLLGYSFLLVARKNEQGRVIETNCEDISYAALLAKQIGCDYFELKHSFDQRHFLIDLPHDIVLRVVKQLDYLKSLETPFFRILINSSMQMLLGNKITLPPKAYNKCLVAELRSVLTSQGAFICSYFRGNNSKNYGDPTVTSIIDLWNSSLRKGILTNTNPSIDCKFHCARDNMNLALYRLGMNETCSPKILEDYDLFL